MTTVDWARLQFAVVTLFHFIFVPLTIGLAVWVAICQTRYYRSRDEVWLRSTHFWGKFLLISMSIGVVTGIVLEFQFGMNWSLYSRYVGDIFGAPLAMEALIAFFAESTFIGLWIFGWNKLPEKVHLAMIWLTAVASAASAYFILVANSFMQYPTGYRINPITHRAELTNVFSLLTNKVALLAVPHTIIGALATGGMMVISICCLLLLRGRSNQVLTRSLRMALPFTAVMAFLTITVGDSLGRVLMDVQPVKMAVGENIWHTTDGAGFQIIPGVSIPHVLSLIEKLSWNGQVEGIHAAAAKMAAHYGAGNYVPIVLLSYWGFHMMLYFGGLIFALTLVGSVMLRGGMVFRAKWFQAIGMFGFVGPLFANWGGWIFAEVGRQPWAVYGLLRTSDANSPNVSTTNIVITLTAFIIIYGVLAAVGGWLMWREAGNGPTPDPSDVESTKPKSPAELARDSMILTY